MGSFERKKQRFQRNYYKYISILNRKKADFKKSALFILLKNYLFCQLFSQLDNAAGICPLIIIPAADLDHIAKDHCRTRVKDT